MYWAVKGRVLFFRVHPWSFFARVSKTNMDTGKLGILGYWIKAAESSKLSSAHPLFRKKRSKRWASAAQLDVRAVCIWPVWGDIANEVFFSLAHTWCEILTELTLPWNAYEQWHFWAKTCTSATFEGSFFSLLTTDVSFGAELLALNREIFPRNLTTKATHERTMKEYESSFNKCCVSFVDAN